MTKHIEIKYKKDGEIRSVVYSYKHKYASRKSIKVRFYNDYPNARILTFGAEKW